MFLSEKKYLNFIPYNPKTLFANWNIEFYKNYKFDDIASLDAAVNTPVQFDVTKDVIIKTSKRLERSIDLVITAVGTGAIVDLIEKNIDELESYINSITLTDLKDIDLSRWVKINNSKIILKKKIGDLLNHNFIKELSADMFYGNELFGDIPNRFVYKNNNKLYDIWVRAYSPNPLPKIIEEKVKIILSSIYYKNKFPKIFSPEIGKILKFDIAFKRRIFSKEVEFYYKDYPNNSIFAISDETYYILFYLYEKLKKGGTILYHDYGFFSPANIHLIHNFLRADNENNHFIRNYYGEFTTEPSFDYAYGKLENSVNKISVIKTLERVSEVTKTPKELVNLDGDIRDDNFFITLIQERLELWGYSYHIKCNDIVKKYIEDLKTNNYIDLDNILLELKTLFDIDNENYLLTLKKILLGYFNDDDHRFLTIEINK